MRTAPAAIVTLILALPAAAQEELKPIPPRYDVNAILQNYPQATPKEAVGSVLRAIERERFDYLAAQLIDPAYVDAQVKQNGVTFAQLVAGIRRSLREDPDDLKRFRQIARDGAIDIQGQQAVIALDSIPDKKIYLRQIGNRWFVENRHSEGTADR